MAESYRARYLTRARGQALIRSLTRTLGDVAGWLLPSTCLVCGTRVDTRQTDALPSVCSACELQIAPPLPYTCSRCGAALGPHASPVGNCPHCRGRRLRFRSVTCAGMYEGPLKSVLLSAKWSWSTVNIRTLAQVCVRARADQLSGLGVDRIIPVPQNWTKRLLRHFNPAMIIGRECARALGRPLDPHILCRRRGTKPQKRVAMDSRFANQNNSFRVQNSRMINGQRLLIVDDVLTTGATCNEATRILLQAGARECHVAVIARVLDHST